ncbi:serine/threonine protein kinase [Pyxidicoccus fallax]|uniref:non-specific serine/threonine protein kinase n=1 Tax=Pyxidicoccus fallax TaxID=394095 RepID=A0A848LZ38_9BACT|nr:serine/threonine-protein kinase [Pyxidicoccus fallax]NMO23387.1 serine/threonine protein kinase [Pyxidicoccus fallax]NPC86755.1 serine/threonine protein kinase [Pyxidicoccus fallax]
MPLKVIGPYRVLETLGSGGAGTVYRALDRRTNDEVALKLLSGGPALDARAARRLAREFETLADLSHPNVVKVFESGVHEGVPYLAMELIEGLTLRHYLDMSSEDLLSHPTGYNTPRSPLSVRRTADDDFGSGSESDSLADSEDGGDRVFGLAAFADEAPSEDLASFAGGGMSGGMSLAAYGSDDSLDSYVPPPVPRHPEPEERGRVLRVEDLNRPERMGRLKDAMLQVCEALAYIHGHGLVHRDLKPSNIMVDEDRQVRLMDFGLAKFLADDVAITEAGKLVGTYRYMAPEQILGEPLDGRSDLYSLGVILYELLSGRPPFDAKTPHELWRQVLETEPPPVLALNLHGDPQLARVAHRLIRKEPDDRFQTAEEVYEALSE